MSLVRLFVQRILLGLIAIWAVLSLIFTLFTVTGDWVLDRMLAYEGLGGTTQERIDEIREEYLAARGLDRPLYEQYFDWMGNMLTLQWGESFESGQAVFPMVMDATVRTATYVVPALLLATVLGLGVGLYAATYDRSLRGGGVTGLTYLAFGLPNFWLGALILSFGGLGMGFAWQMNFNRIRTFEMPFVYEYVVPVLLVATTLLAAVVSYARAYSLQHGSAEFTKLLRAKGASRVTVARHVLRNAAIPLLSLVFAETLALIAISVVVIEAVFGIGGIGELFYTAVWTRDLPVMMGASVVVVTVGVVGNVLQDLAYSVLDPRVDTGTR